MITDTPTLLTRANAEEIAARVSAEDSEWEYRVVETGEGSGVFTIRVYDEMGFYLGSL
jgi:hypothetical protein